MSLNTFGQVSGIYFTEFWKHTESEQSNVFMNFTKRKYTTETLNRETLARKRTEIWLFMISRTPLFSIYVILKTAPSSLLQGRCFLIELFYQILMILERVGRDLLQREPCNLIVVILCVYCRRQHCSPDVAFNLALFSIIGKKDLCFGR